MLLTIAAVLIILWLLSVVGVYAIGGLTYVLLILAIAVVLVWVVFGEYPFDPR